MFEIEIEPCYPLMNAEHVDEILVPSFLDGDSFSFWVHTRIGLVRIVTTNSLN